MIDPTQNMTLAEHETSPNPNAAPQPEPLQLEDEAPETPAVTQQTPVDIEPTTSAQEAPQQPAEPPTDNNDATHSVLATTNLQDSLAAIMDSGLMQLLAPFFAMIANMLGLDKRVDGLTSNIRETAPDVARAAANGADPAATVGEEQPDLANMTYETSTATIDLASLGPMAVQQFDAEWNDITEAGQLTGQQIIDMLGDNPSIERMVDAEGATSGFRLGGQLYLPATGEETLPLEMREAIVSNIAEPAPAVAPDGPSTDPGMNIAALEEQQRQQMLAQTQMQNAPSGPGGMAA